MLYIQCALFVCLSLYCHNHIFNPDIYHLLCTSKAGLIFLKYHLHHVTLLLEIFWLFLDCLQEMFKLINLPFKTFLKSQLIFCTLMFSYTFYCTLLDFHCFLKTPLSQLLVVFRHSVCALNAFFLALLKSYYPLYPILQTPLISISLSWTGHFIVIFSFFGWFWSFLSFGPFCLVLLFNRM